MRKQFSKLFFFLLSFCFVAKLYAATSVTVADPDDMTFYAGVDQSSYFEIIYDSQTTQAESRTSAFKIYVPVASSSNEDYSIIDKEKLPTTTNGFLKFKVLLKNSSGSTRYLKAATYKSDDIYTVFNLENSVSIPSGNSTYTATVEINYTDASSLCGVGTACTLSSSSTTDRYIYLFLTTNNGLAAGEEITVDDDTNSGGAYFHPYFSGVLPEVSVESTLIKKGDGRLTISYKSNSVANSYKTLVFRHAGSTEITDQDVAIQDASGQSFVLDDEDVTLSDFYHLFSFKEDGDIIVSDLTNGENYNLSVAHVNKYFFATPLSNSKVMVPEKIEQFLEKSACYFLSAGFKHDHFILTYFRFIRDHIMLTNGVGRAFVQWYYKTAPHYANEIYRSKLLSLGIKIAAWGLFFAANLLILMVLLITSLLFLRFFNKKQFEFFLQGLKISIGNNPLSRIYNDR